MWKNKERSVDRGGVFGLSLIKHVTLQKIVAHDFRYDPRTQILFVIESVHYINKVIQTVKV
jgi:hypothetical protein